MVGRVKRLRVQGYRSVRDIEVNFGDVNLVTGPNGCGKSNLFNAFRLLKAALQGRLAQALAEEGGLESVLWAGPVSKDEKRILTLDLEADPFEYKLQIGVRPQSEFPLFPLDPQIKSEVIKLEGRVVMDRGRSVAKMRPINGPSELRTDLVDSESIFAQILDPRRYSELYLLKEMVERWIFYHEFRTDSESPIRRPGLATYANRLSESGDNLAAMLLVLQNRGDWERYSAILNDTFPGQRFSSDEGSEISVYTEELHRPVSAKELSDGTLKFLCLATACFSVRQPPLIAFNEPENSLNPSAIEPLAEALAYASQYSQLWITTHSEPLTKALVNRLACKPIRLSKFEGETVINALASRKGYRLEDA